MVITFEPKQIFKIAAEYTQLGYMMAIKSYMPMEDLIKEKDVKRWFKVMNVPFNLFKELVDKRELKGIYKGTSLNSPRYYSKSQIIEKMNAVDIFGMIRDAELASC